MRGGGLKKNKLQAHGRKKQKGFQQRGTQEGRANSRGDPHSPDDESQIYKAVLAKRAPIFECTAGEKREKGRGKAQRQRRQRRSSSLLKKSRTQTPKRRRKKYCQQENQGYPSQERQKKDAICLPLGPCTTGVNSKMVQLPFRRRPD